MLVRETGNGPTFKEPFNDTGETLQGCHSGGDGGFRYNNRYHGKRYKKRRPGFTHYYNGYWYALPFWLYSYDYYEPYYYGDGVSDWELHVEWCHNRYRSYREDLDAYKGYDGKWHRCISPYSY